MTNKDNIKLVATDLDGTLLNTKKELPDKIFKVIKELKKMGVLFVAATGRQYYNVHWNFQPVIQDIIILADNGGVSFQDNMLIGSIPIETDWHLYIDKIKEIPLAYPVLCCVDKAYIKDLGMDFLRNVTNYYRRFEVVPDFRYIDDIVIKIAVCDEQNAERNAYPYLKGFEDQVQVKVSGDEWVDINSKDCNKGVAIRNLQKSFGITKDQTMVFGDFLNDLEMMDQAKYSYAMRNAHPKLKEAAKYETSSNNENGVIKQLEAHFGFNINDL